MNYHHLTINERACIYQFKQLGMSIRKIAEALNKSPSTISRELKRNYCGRRYKYLPHIAEEKYSKRRVNCHRPIRIDVDAINYIENKINELKKILDNCLNDDECFSDVFNELIDRIYVSAT